MFFKIIDRLLIVFFLSMSSFCEMEIVSWGDSIKISDSLLVFVPLLVDLTGEICVRFWSCVSKNCSKKSIPWFNRETSVYSRVLLGTSTEGMVLIRFELLSIGSSNDFDKKKELSCLVGLFIVSPWSLSVFTISQKQPSDTPLSSWKFLRKF